MRKKKLMYTKNVKTHEFQAYRGKYIACYTDVWARYGCGKEEDLLLMKS